jgi:hypothetical protein
MRPILRSFLMVRRSGFLFGAGFAVLACEIALLQDYQSVSGYLFERYALLTAAFMLGTAAGSRLFLKHPDRSKASRRPPPAFTLALSALALWAAGAGILRMLGPGTAPLGVDGAAILLNLLGGLASGAAFTIAAREMMGRWQAKAVNQSLYAFDLFGSALAAFLSPFVLIPFLGTSMTQALMAVLLAGLTFTEWRGVHAEA